ncbi:MAG: ABC transporter ATP-binding protein [Candidatus Cyclobacteriaceae bacterium M2_1C_046]
MIEIRNLHKSFKKNHVLQGIDFYATEGKITSILGPNGSGKTTMIKSVVGLNTIDAGEIIVNGKSVKNSWNYRRSISYLPQVSRFPDNLKINDIISMIKDIRGQESREDYLIDLFDLHKHMGTKLSQLSGGTRQKVNLVLTFMFDTPLIILDEPTVGLDPVAMIRLKDLILEEKAKGKTVLITTHIMELVEEITDDLIFLLEGKIYFKGSISEMKKQTGEHNLERSIAKILMSTEETEMKIAS